MKRKSTLSQPFYDPKKTYEDNYESGPFGAWKDHRHPHFAATRQGTPQINFLGQKVYLPFGIPAGPLLNSAFTTAAFRAGFDLCVYKTVRTKSQAVHPWPNVLAVHLEEEASGKLRHDRSQPLLADDQYTDPLMITNSFGVPSRDPDVWQPDMEKAVRAVGKGQALIGSFQGTNRGGSPAEFIADYVLAARLVQETGAPILEANLSCPNEGKANLVCYDLERTAEIAQSIKARIGNTPLLLKLGYFADDHELRKLIQLTGTIVDGYSAINTIPATIVNEVGQPALPGKGRERSGVCGVGIQWAGVEMVRRLALLRQELKVPFTIVGVGGVMVPEDYLTYQNAGADAVMSATGAMWNPQLAEEIWHKKQGKH